MVSPNDVTTPVAESASGTPEAQPQEPQAMSTPGVTGGPVESAPGASGSSALPSHATEGVYVVREGDTLWSAALEIGMDLEDMPCAISPDFRLDQPLVIGDSILPPPEGAICHQAVTGETAASIAALYGVDPSVITGDPWNQLTVVANQEGAGGQPQDGQPQDGQPQDGQPQDGQPQDGQPQGLPLQAGRYVRILPDAAAQVGALWLPGGLLDTEGSGFLAYMLNQPVGVTPFMAYAVGGPRRVASPSAVPADWPYGSGRFIWPVYGWVSQGYRQDHRAVDIAAPSSTFMMAADRGVVVRAGWNNQGYGMFVVIDHNIDYVTLYSHLQDVYVDVGDVVAQGQVIGTVGSTGNSTGPHLHFELRDFGARINPLEALLR